MQLALKLPHKRAKEDEEEIQGVTASLASTKEISANAAVTADLSELGCLFALKQQPTNFLSGKDVFA